MSTEDWIYRFGDVEVEPAAHRITRDGHELGVEPKAFAVLVALLEQAGRALERDDLLDRVWGHRHVTPGVLNRVVAQLRKALGDEAEHPRYIQTLHSLGYRFIADVQRVSAQVPEPQPVPDEPTPVVVASAQVPPFPSATAAPARRRWWLPAAVALPAIAVAVAWWQQQQAPVRPAASIAVLPFTSLGSNRDDSYFAEGLAVDMHDALAHVQGLTVAAQMSPSATNRNVDAKDIGERFGVATVLDASVRREGSRLRISARLSDTATGYTLWSRTYDRQSSDVFATQSEIAAQVVKELMVVLPDDGRALAHRLAPTRSITAYESYLKGMKELRRAGDGGDMRIAKVFFNEALAADRGFARAQAGLCRSELGRFENKQDADIFGNAQAACLLAAKMDPELREVNLALGELNRIGGNLAKANEHYAKVQDDPVLGPAAHVGMGKVQSAEGRHDLALGHFEHALALRPDDASIHRAIGFQHYLDEHLDKAIESYRRATSLEPGNADAWSSLGGLHLADGNTAAAAAAFERSIAIEPTDIGLTNFGALKYAGGDFAGAADLFRRATVLEPGDFRLWGNLGEALLEVPGGTTQAREPFLRAAELAARYVQVKPDDAQALALLAWYRANLGDSAGARELAARAEALATARGEVALRNAQTFVSLGDEAAARERLDRARREGVAEDRIQTTPVFRRLPGAGSGKTALQGGKR